jgi:hypothetical protein
MHEETKGKSSHSPQTSSPDMDSTSRRHNMQRIKMMFFLEKNVDIWLVPCGRGGHWSSHVRCGGSGDIIWRGAHSNPCDFRAPKSRIMSERTYDSSQSDNHHRKDLQGFSWGSWLYSWRWWHEVAIQYKEYCTWWSDISPHCIKCWASESAFIVNY